MTINLKVINFRHVAIYYQVIHYFFYKNLERS
jgi:hypothetical protein